MPLAANFNFRVSSKCIHSESIIGLLPSTPSDVDIRASSNESPFFSAFHSWDLPKQVSCYVGIFTQKSSSRSMNLLLLDVTIISGGF